MPAKRIFHRGLTPVGIAGIAAQRNPYQPRKPFNANSLPNRNPNPSHGSDGGALAKTSSRGGR